MATERSPRLIISATFTAEPVEPTVAFWLRRFKLPVEIQFAPYNQVFQELVGESGLLAGNSDGVNAILLRLDDWLGAGANQLERSAGEFVAAMRTAAARSAVPQIVCICPPPAATLASPDKAAQISRAEAAIAEGLAEEPGVHVVTSAELARRYFVKDYDSPVTDQLGKVPYTPDFYTALGTMLARRVWALRSPPYKVIALDCDGTLWQGTCGEEGPDGVQFPAPWKQLQEFMVAQHDAGMLLCICSKNSDEDVFAVFDRRKEEMPLKREHIVAWRVNWIAKSENLRSLAAELELGLDSFIMLDDNPIECAEIGAHTPEVLALQLPAEAGKIGNFLSRTWAFDHLKVTQEDQQRTGLYRANRQREAARAGSMTMRDFLDGLQLEVVIEPATAEQLERIAQLTQRTNQFNVSGLRRTRSELRRACELEGRKCLSVQVRDRFGDYGLVGALIYSTAPELLRVDSFLLSCRSLGRRVEHRMLAELGKLAAENGAGHVEIEATVTAKNKPAFDFLDSFGEQYKQALAGHAVFRLPAGLAASAGNI